MNKKFCKGCNTDKPTSEFSKANGKPDGLQSVCKSCYKKKYAHKRKRSRVKIKDTQNGYKKPKYEREELLKQIAELRQRESDSQTMTGYDFSFLWTNEKFLE